MLKILHTGDIHLDSPFSSLTPKQSQVRKNELRAAFTSMMTYARMNSVDIILIAGDLFDHEFVTRETVALLCHEFEKAAIPVVISPGNHDHISEKSIWLRGVFPENVHVFTDSALSKFSFDELNTDVYGFAFEDIALRSNPINGASVENKARINLLCAHMDTNSPLSPYCPVTASQLAAFGADYTAMAHIHNAAEPIELQGGAVAAYCGCLEGRDYTETGAKGALVAEIEKTGEAAKIKLQRVRFSKRRYEKLTLSVDACRTNTELASRINDAIADGHFGEDTLLSVTLNGSVSPEVLIDCKELALSIGGVFACELHDETLPLWDSAVLEADRGIRGELYRLLLPQMTDDDEKVRECAKNALIYALRAVGGEPPRA